MQHTEGVFRLEAVVGQSMADGGKWHVAGYVHNGDETAPVEWVQVSERFDTRTDAHEAGIRHARALASTLPADHTAAKKRSQAWGQAGIGQ